MKTTIAVLCVGLAGVIAGCEIGELEVGDFFCNLGRSCDGDTDADADSDTGADADSDTGADADSDTGADADSDTGADADTDTYSEEDTEEDTDTNADETYLLPDENGWIDATTNTSQIQGSWWTATDQESGGSSTIELEIIPGEGVCAYGTVGQGVNDNWSTHWGAMIGLTLCQNDIDEEPEGGVYTMSGCPRPISMFDKFAPFIDAFSVFIETDSVVRVGFKERDRTDFAYITVTAANTEPQYYFVNEATVEYDPTQPGVNRTNVESLIFHVPTNPWYPEDFTLCIYDLKPSVIINLV